MQQSPSGTNKVDDKQARKRHQNRFAQQKHRKKLKSHIQDLEKRAALADHILNPTGNPKITSNDGLSQSCNYSVPSSGHNGHAMMHPDNATPASVMQSCELSAMEAQMNSSSISRSPPDRSNEHYPSPSNESSFLGAAPSSHLFDDVDFLKAFANSEDHLRSRPLNFHEAGNLELQMNDGEMPGPLSFNARHEILETLKTPSPIPSRCSSSTAMSKLLHQPPAQEQAALESRVDYVLQSIKKAGFKSPDSFVSCYYTSVYKDSSALKLQQESSRSKGLPQILEDLRVKSSSWSTWELSGYRDAIVKSAADLIAGEFERLTRKKYSCEIELQQNLARMPQVPDGISSMHQLPSIAAELKKTLRDELPNLHALMAALSVQKTASAQSTRIQLLIATIQVIVTSKDEPLQEAAKWVLNRIAPEYSGDPLHTFGDEFDDRLTQSG